MRVDRKALAEMAEKFFSHQPVLFLDDEGCAVFPIFKSGETETNVAAVWFIDRTVPASHTFHKLGIQVELRETSYLHGLN